MKQFSVSGRQFLLVFILALHCIVVKSQDLPGAGSNLQTAPAGTLVIAMDNTNQACSVIDPATGTYLFNLKAYGLAIFLLDLDYNLQWVIKSGKTHDGIDFTASAERVLPTYLAPQSYDFSAGPILIFPNDTADITSAINWFNMYQYDSSKVKVYRLQSATTVDVRYTLANKPRAALLHDSCDIHRNFMEIASVPTMNYDCLPDASTLRSGCYTIATEPHTVSSDLTSFDADSIYNFVMAGGNFLAECEGVQTYEGLKLFQSSTGVIVDPTGGQYQNFNNNVFYDNADMAFGQYQGVFQPWLRGAQKIWRYAGTTTNNWYSVTSCRRNILDNINYVATVSKLTVDTGSLVFYLGNHEYYTNDCHTCVAGNAFNEAEINGIRMFLNAVLVPSKVPICAINFILPVQLNEFFAFKKNDNAVLLEWNSITEEENTLFFIEHSTNGTGFATVGQVSGSGIEGFNYEFMHGDPGEGLNYYRLKMISASGKAVYSPVRKIMFGNNNKLLNIYPNPAFAVANIMLDAEDGERLQVDLFDVAGRQLKQSLLVVRNQRVELKLEDINKGMYWVIATTADGNQYKSKLLIAR